MSKAFLFRQTIGKPNDHISAPTLHTRTMGEGRIRIPSTPIILGPSRLDFLISTLQKIMSPELATISATKSSTSILDRYQNHWKRFATFSGGQQISIPVILRYFLALFNENLAIRTILVHKSALMDPLFYGFNINLNDKVCLDFIKGLKTRRPVKKSLPPEWDVDIVLAFLKTPKFRKNDSIELAPLLLKTIFLVGLASGARIGDWSALRRDKDHCNFWLNNKGVSMCQREF